MPGLPDFSGNVPEHRKWGGANFSNNLRLWLSHPGCHSDCMMLSPPPRAWVDWTVPTDKSGREIGVCRTQPDYQFYLHWLADYLYETEIPVPACQRELVERFRSGDGADDAAFHLGEDMGYLLLDLEAYERSSLEGTSWEELNEFEREMYESVWGDDRETYSLEEFCASREEYAQIGREAREAETIPEAIGHADIPFRAIFAALLREVPDHGERYRCLDRFYCSFNEAASK